MCGVLYTQLLSSKKDLTGGNFERQESLSTPDGSLLQLLAIAVKSANSGNCAAFLRDYALKTATNKFQVSAVFLLTS